MQANFGVGYPSVGGRGLECSHPASIGFNNFLSEVDAVDGNDKSVDRRALISLIHDIPDDLLQYIPARLALEQQKPDVSYLMIG